MRLLIVRVGAMGDVLHALPAVAALRRARPETEIGWVIDARWRPLLEDTTGHHPIVDTVHAIDTRAWKRGPLAPATIASIVALRNELRDADYETAIDLQGSLRSGIIARLSGAPAIFGAAEPRERPARIFYRTRVATRSVHADSPPTGSPPPAGRRGHPAL